MICQEVPKRSLGEVWPRVSHLLEKSLSKGDDWWTLDYLLDTLETHDDAALFVIADHDGIYGAAVIIVEEGPNGKVFGHYPAMGGREFFDWKDLLIETAEEWARDRGASVMSVTGRHGWRRVLDKYGYKQSAVVLEKPL